MANDDQAPKTPAADSSTSQPKPDTADQLNRRDVVVGAAHAAQLVELGNPALRGAAKMVGVADAVKITADFAQGKEVRAPDVASAAASVAMTTGAGGPVVQTAATLIAGASAVDSGERAFNTLKAKLKEVDPADTTERRAVEARNDELAIAPRDSMSVEEMRKLVKLDIASLHRIDDSRELHSAAVAMGSNAYDQKNYKAELARQDPYYYEQVMLAFAKEQQSIFAKEDRKAAEFAAADAPRPQLNSIERVSSRETEAALERQTPARSGDTPLEDRFSVVTRLARGRDYEFRDQPGKVAFKERWVSMTSTVDSPAVVKAMVDRADERGWKDVRVSGSLEFQRQAWIAATARGIKAVGYEPTDGDRYAAREESIRLGKTRVEPQQPQERKPAQEASNQPQFVKQPAPTVAPSPERPIADRVHAGRVVGHGHDHFNFDKAKEQSYFVKLATTSGEKVIWGVDLERALKDSQIKVGDDVRLQNRGAQPVTIPIKDRDEAGKVTGSHEEVVKRNSWEAARIEPSRDLAAARPAGHALVFEALEKAFRETNVPEQFRDRMRDTARKELDARESSGQEIRVAIYDPAASRQTQRPSPAPEVRRPEQERSR